MFCEQCGAEIPEGALFCGKCGSKTPSDVPAAQEPGALGQVPPGGMEAFAEGAPAAGQAAPFGQEPAAAQAGPIPRSVPAKAKGDPARRNKIILIVSIAVAVAAIAFIAVMFAFQNAPNTPNGQAGTTQTATTQTATTQTGAADEKGGKPGQTDNTEDAAPAGESKEEPEPEVEPEPAPAPAPASALIDLSNPTDYYDINIFLSNFAEWDPFYRYDGHPYDRNNYDLRQLVNWGMWHNAINNDGTLIYEEAYLPDAPDTQTGDVGGSDSRKAYPRHMETSRIENSISRYMGIDLDLSGYNSGDGAYYEQGGLMYEGLYRGDSPWLRNVALADRVEDVGNGQVRVNFTIYIENGSNEYGVISDKSWYGLNPSELEQAMYADGARGFSMCSGTAVVDVNGSGSDRTFTLASFSVDV